MVLGVSECAQGCCLKVKVVPKAGRCGMLAPKGPDDVCLPPRVQTIPTGRFA